MSSLAHFGELALQSGNGFRPTISECLAITGFIFSRNLASGPPAAP